MYENDIMALGKEKSTVEKMSIILIMTFSSKDNKGFGYIGCVCIIYWANVELSNLWFVI